MSPRKVRVFFYGSFMNRDVLAQAGLIPDAIQVGRVDGFDIRIRPLANLVPADGASVHGIVCEATHEELARLYGQDWVGTYLPEAVHVSLADGSTIPALCYIAPDRTEDPAADDYLDRIVGPAREYGFPEPYVQRLERYRSRSTSQDPR